MALSVFNWWLCFGHSQVSAVVLPIGLKFLPSSRTRPETKSLSPPFLFRKARPRTVSTPFTNHSTTTPIVPYFSSIPIWFRPAPRRSAGKGWDTDERHW